MLLQPTQSTVSDVLHLNKINYNIQTSGNNILFPGYNETVLIELKRLYSYQNT